MPSYSRALHIFRRDLRLQDNTALFKAIEDSNEVLCLFVATPTQLEDNPYYSEKAAQCMRVSLEELRADIAQNDGALMVLYADPVMALEAVKEAVTFDAVYVNADYTPYSQQRDTRLADWCHTHNISFHSYHDALLNPPGKIMTQKNTPYTVFTPYYRQANTQSISEPTYRHHFPLWRGSLPDATTVSAICGGDTTQHQRHVIGGRSEGLTLLRRLADLNYTEDRDLPSADGTSGLSAHNKFGTVSIREVAQAAQRNMPPEEAESFIRQLHFRDFYTHIAYHFPAVFGQEFQTQFRGMPWSYDTELFSAWKQGMTGFPIVDAAMRQLHHTGYMHNRCRMIVASFLTKDLHIDWRWGEQYFAQQLVDYDPAVNNASWQWAASTGSDAQPYFRIFNPWRQQERFDPEARYITQWVPELRDLSAQAIHALHTNRPATLSDTYPAPIVSHQKERQRALARYKRQLGHQYND